MASHLKLCSCHARRLFDWFSLSLSPSLSPSLTHRIAPVDLHLLAGREQQAVRPSFKIQEYFLANPDIILHSQQFSLIAAHGSSANLQWQLHPVVPDPPSFTSRCHYSTPSPLHRPQHPTQTIHSTRIKTIQPRPPHRPAPFSARLRIYPYSMSGVKKSRSRTCTGQSQVRHARSWCCSYGTSSVVYVCRPAYVAHTDPLHRTARSTCALYAPKCLQVLYQATQP